MSVLVVDHGILFDFDHHAGRRHPGADPKGDRFYSGEEFAVGSAVGGIADVPAIQTNGPSRFARELAPMISSRPPPDAVIAAMNTVYVTRKRGSKNV